MTPLTSLTDIAEHCRLKAEAARWAARRAEGVTVNVDGYSQLIRRAKESGCFLWMLHRQVDAPVLDTMSAYFGHVGDLVELASHIQTELPNSKKTWIDLLHLLADAQAALRKAVTAVGSSDDETQVQLYDWLLDQARKLRIYLPSLRADYISEQTPQGSLPGRINQLRTAVRERCERTRHVERLFDLLLELMLKLKAGDAAANHWADIGVVLDELILAGIAPSSPRIRELILPHVDNAPAFALPRGSALAVREINCFRDRQSVSGRISQAAYSPQVEIAARLLKGRSVVLIGGDERPLTKRLLEQALGIQELVWISTTHGTSVSSFQPFVARPEVALVLLAIRWASHRFTDVQQFCRWYKRPLVRLPGGMNPEQVAHQILLQASTRLRRQVSGL